MQQRWFVASDNYHFGHSGQNKYMQHQIQLVAFSVIVMLPVGVPLLNSPPGAGAGAPASQSILTRCSKYYSNQSGFGRKREFEVIKF